MFRTIVCCIILSCLLFACQSDHHEKAKEKEVERMVDSIDIERSIEKESFLVSDPFKHMVDSLVMDNYRLLSFDSLELNSHFLNKRIDELNRYRKLQEKSMIPPLESRGLRSIRRAKVKGTKDLGGGLYYRANLETWAFEDKISAKKALKEVEQLKEDVPWDEISKSPITFMVIENELVFITPGGFYMLDEAERLKAFLEEGWEKF